MSPFPKAAKICLQMELQSKDPSTYCKGLNTASVRFRQAHCPRRQCYRLAVPMEHGLFRGQMPQGRTTTCVGDSYWSHAQFQLIHWRHHAAGG